MTNSPALPSAAAPRPSRTAPITAAALLMALLAAAAITQVQHRSDQRRLGQLSLTQLDQQAQRLHALERENADDPSLVGGNMSRAAAIEAQAQSLAQSLRQSDAHGRTLPRVTQDLGAYERAADDEFRLYRTGHGAEARGAGAERAAAAFDALADTIEDANAAFARQAAAANAAADAGTVAILLLAAVLLSALFRRAETAQRHGLRAEAEREAVGRSEQRFQALGRHASEVIVILTPAGDIRYLSAAARRLWGYAPEALEGTSVFALMRADEWDRAQALIAQAAADAGGGVRAEMHLRYADGAWRPSEVVLANLLGEPGVEGIVLTCRDISERKTFETQLAHQAFHDMLTGLPNRALFVERLRHALTRARRRAGLVAVVFLDLDNFKVVNDSLGHEAGDRLLLTVAERLSACVRPGDTVARQGGDEFALLLEDLADEGQVQGVVERIAEVLRAPVRAGGREVFTTGSLGIALSRGDDRTPDELLRDADTAMYQAKTGGKAHSVLFDHSMNADAVERLELETGLRRALENGEFRVLYQPIVALATGRLNEVEALVRWERPGRGLVAPSDFIPLAEETGLIVPLGQWVLREACRQARAWQAQFPSEPALTVSVNLSSRQLLQADIVDQVAQALRETGLGAASLKLEITESVMMLDAEATIAKLHRLRALGIRLAVDDFGTGYCSMAYLGTLPLDTLKIDRSFVSKMGRHDEGDAIVRAIVTLAKTLNLHITSEGIETREQLAQLLALGCDQGQGYHFARPLSPDALGQMLADAQGQVLADAQGQVLADAQGQVLADAQGQVLADAQGQVLADARAPRAEPRRLPRAA